MFQDNTAKDNGGVIASRGTNECEVRITRSTFEGNQAQQSGGAIFMVPFASTSWVLGHSLFSNNLASFGGALANENPLFSPLLENGSSRFCVLKRPFWLTSLFFLICTLVTFANNKATTYGDDLSSPPSSISSSFPSDLSLLSGSPLPTFNVKLEDVFGGIYSFPPNQPFDVFFLPSFLPSFLPFSFLCVNDATQIPLFSFP